MQLADNRYVVLGLAAMAAVMLVPLLSVAIPPLTDLPNHISRLHILTTLDGDPELQKNYAASWWPMPNLAIDVLGWPVTRLLSPYAAGKAFAVLAFATALLGMFALHYTAHRSVNAWSGMIFFVAYNQAFTFGLLNFYFGVGLAFLLLAGWIRCEGTHAARRVWLFPAAALALYFCHLLAFGVYGLLVAGYELSGLLRSREKRIPVILRRAAIAGVQFLVPVAILILTAGADTGMVSGTHYGALLNKVLSLLAPFRVYVEPIDLAAILFVLAVLVIAWWKKQLRIGPGLGVPLLAVAVLALATPTVVMSMFGLDQRFAVVAGMLLFAVMRIELPARGAAALLLAAGMALLVWRAADLTVHWRQFDAQYAELRGAVKVMDRGASVLPVQHLGGEQHRSEPLGSAFVYWHAASLAVVERSLFNPQTFMARHQPIKASPAREPLDCRACRPITPDALRVLGKSEIAWETLELPYGLRFPYLHAAHWNERFDYVLVVDFGDHVNPAPGRLAPRHTGSFFVIYENRGRPRG